jgi:hypothetical protein
MCATLIYSMPNQRDPSMKRTTITVGAALYEWAKAEAKRRGINDFSTFVRTLIAKEKNAQERPNENKG